jgi:hypothetical protein
VKKTSWFIFLLFLAVSCLDDPDCFRLNNNYVGIAFRVMGSSSLDTVFLYGVEAAGLRFSAADTTFTTRTDVQVDFFNDQTTFTFLGKDGNHTLALGYSAKTQFVSEDCGPRYILSDLSVLSADFDGDSVRVISKTPTSSQSTHIEIFRCPHPDTLGLMFKQLTLNPAQTNQNSRAIGAALTNIMVDGITELYPGKRATTVRLPVNLTPGENTSTTYTFNFADDYGFTTPTRTLKISHDVNSEQRYRPCGTQTFVTDILPELSDFDSIRLTLDEDGLARDALTDPIITNLEVFRCPITNIIQIAFREEVGLSVRTDTVDIASIKTDYNANLYYENSKVTTVQLPLNLDANSTTFTIDYNGGDDARPDAVITFTYTCNTRDYYKNACGDTQTVITELATTFLTGSVSTRSIQYPPVTNVTITKPD